MNNTNLLANPNVFSAIRTLPSFSKHARAMRSHFEAVFNDPMRARSERFCWDYWNVPGQYRLLRTPATEFFGPAGQKFIEELTAYGRKFLGCQMISHPWMSSYLDGHYQNLHSDVPHGPYSFVFSLTPYSRVAWPTRAFRGGETLVAKPKLLRYFRDLKSSESDEESQLFHRLQQPFNQLTIFDPRYPHGVSRVEGNDDLLKSRLVIHGWFTEPRPMLEGALTERKAGPVMDLIAQHMIQGLSSMGYTGLLSLRLQINSEGNLMRTEVLASHLTNIMGDVISIRLLKQVFAPLAHQSRGLFPKASRPTRITLPIEFRS
ncbi:MAG: hypothetical protein JST80_05140 [Bdellovibrionales bacterium]|nr:hypothetical protein [Bdellovibrionales bacterium]